jgi:site-specific recombinase XerD
MLERAAVEAKIKIRFIPTCCATAPGYKLANDGVDTRSLQAYLGHKNIQHTVRYTELAPDRFKGFWRD